MCKILHIATDEKFINNANLLFEECFPKNNQFYIIVANCDNDLIHVSETENIKKVSQDIKSIKKLARSLNESNTVVVHGLFYHSSVLVNSLNPKIKVVWILFGKEFHENPIFRNQTRLYGAKTLNVLYGNSLQHKLILFVKQIFRDSNYFFRYRTFGPYTETYKASKRVDFLGILFKEEFNLIASKIENKNLEFFKFSYYPIEQMVSNINSKVKGSNILLGNSSNITGNHLDVLDVLSEIGIGERKIICPLSYGNDRSASIIKEYGTTLFKNNFVPLMDFMPLHKYNSYLEQCGIVIMNNFRQQAVGNIMTMLWMGAKVFLDERNTHYWYLKRLNIHVFSIKNDIYDANAFKLLSEEEIAHNRSVIISEIGKKQLLKDLNSISDIFI